MMNNSNAQQQQRLSSRASAQQREISAMHYHTWPNAGTSMHGARHMYAYCCAIYFHCFPLAK
jgi:hypothetical protein